MSVLHAADVTFSYRGGAAVLEGVSFDVKAGDVVALIGPNGSGKSTLMRVLAGFLEPDAGTVTLDGRDLMDLSRREIARQLAYVPQDLPADSPFTAREIVMTGRYAHLSPLQMESQRDQDECTRALASMQAEAFADRRVDQLSGGERQRVFLARALASEPRVMLLDEPAAHLDLGYRTELGRRLNTYASEQDVAIVVVHHDLNLAAQTCEKIVLLAGGRVVADGATQDVFTKEVLEEAYGWPVEVDINPATNRPRVTAL